MCYNSTSTKQRHKFSPRAKSCTFLGYPNGFKYYKLLNLESDTVFISRNVVFHESLFPFADSNQSIYIDKLFDDSLDKLVIVEDTEEDVVVSNELIMVAVSEEDVVVSDKSGMDVGSEEAVVAIGIDLSGMVAGKRKAIVADKRKAIVVHNDKFMEVTSSSRKIKQPIHLQDYHCYSIFGTTPYPIICI